VRFPLGSWRSKELVPTTAPVVAADFFFQMYQPIPATAATATTPMMIFVRSS
jgi:hypothetical protein